MLLYKPVHNKASVATQTNYSLCGHTKLKKLLSLTNTLKYIYINAHYLRGKPQKSFNTQYFIPDIIKKGSLHLSTICIITEIIY